MNYVWHLLVILNLYLILALSLNLVVGYTGMVSLCHAAFYGIGAYTTALLTIAGWAFLPAVTLAILSAALASLVVAIPSLRLRGDYFVLATMGFQIIVSSVLYNWVGLTRGPFGITNIPVPAVFGISMDTPARYWLFTGIACVGCSGVLWLLVESPFGRALRSVREDEVAAAALGKDVLHLRLTAFVVGAAIAAVPGALFAGYMRYVDPTSFTLLESVLLVSIVVIGGAGSLMGTVLGSLFLVLLPEALRFLNLPDAAAANLRQIIYGLFLIGIMRFRPQGLFGEYTFD